jgi:hypothetical protein
MRLTACQLLFVLLFLVSAVSLFTIVVHDFFCHEELHRLASPVHHHFHLSAGYSNDLGQSIQEPSGKLPADNIFLIKSDFVSSIFHPPD